MEKIKFDYVSILNLKPTEKPYEVRHDTIKGFGVRVSKTGSKTFFYRYRFGGKNKCYIIGSFPAYKVKDARDKALALTVMVNNDDDPQGERIIKKKKRLIVPVTFKDLTDRFKEIHYPTLRSKTKVEYSRIIDTELIPVLGKLPIKEIDKASIISLLDNKAIKNGKKTMANRIRARLHSIFEFGISRDIIQTNPVTSIKKYTEGEVKRERYYSYEEIKKLWDAFENQEEPMQSVFKILLICGQRSTETRQMKWKHIKNNIWTIPAELSKSNREHHIPLPDMAIQIIENLRPISGKSDYVFESPRLKNQPIEWLKKATKKVRKETVDIDIEKDKKMKNPGVPDFRLHDLRRTAATHMASLNIDRTVLGKLLNHKGLAGDGQVTAIYDRHEYMEEKAQALSRWCFHLQQIIEGKSESKIYKLG
ncbi:MAG: tyrosine-type recombinase/integrase [Balneolales bacterium]